MIGVEVVSCKESLSLLLYKMFPILTYCFENDKNVGCRTVAAAIRRDPPHIWLCHLGQDSNDPKGMLAYFFNSCTAASNQSCFRYLSIRVISSYESPCRSSLTCSKNKIACTLNCHSPPMSSVLSKQVGSSPSSTQHFREIRPLTPAPIIATFFAMVFCQGVGQSMLFSWGKR